MDGIPHRACSHYRTNCSFSFYPSYIFALHPFLNYDQTSPQQNHRKAKKIEAKYRPAVADGTLKSGEGTESTNHLRHISEREPDGNGMQGFAHSIAPA